MGPDPRSRFAISYHRSFLSPAKQTLEARLPQRRVRCIEGMDRIGIDDDINQAPPALATHPQILGMGLRVSSCPDHLGDYVELEVQY